MREYYYRLIYTLFGVLLLSTGMQSIPLAYADVYSDVCPTNLSFSRRSFDPVGNCNCPEGQGEAISLTNKVAQFGGCHSSISVAQSVIELSTLNGKNGFQMNGAAASDETARVIRPAGDVNGDGIDDIIISAYNRDLPAKGDAGVAYVMFGKEDWVGGGYTALELSSALNGTNGFQINGEASGNKLGYTSGVAGVGDVNGDGYDDIAVGAPYNDSSKGAAYIIFGKANWVGGGYVPFEVSSINGTNGFKVTGTNGNDRLGWGIAAAGDLNNDSYDDIAIEGMGDGAGGSGQKGQTIVVFGKANWVGVGYTPLAIASLNGTNGFIVTGIDNYDFLGNGLAAGDINNDGYSDLIMGAPYADLPPSNNAEGEVYVIFGKANGWAASFNLTTLNGFNGFKINGNTTVGQLGYNVTTGKINNDNFYDIIVTDVGYNSSSGRVYVIFGKADWVGGGYVPFEVSSINGTGGFAIDAVAAADNLMAIGTGDINKDGRTDIILGSGMADPSGRSQAGQAYVIYGKTSAWAATFSLSTLNGTNGFTMNGIDNTDRAGAAVSGAGDINNDGFGDVAIGAYWADPNGGDSGEAYVVFGFDPTKPKDY